MPKKKIRDRWKEAELRLKVAALTVALLSSLGIGTMVQSAWGFLEQMQRVDTQQTESIEVISEEVINLRYESDMQRLNKSIKLLTVEIIEYQNEWGGRDIPDAPVDVKVDYEELVEQKASDKEERKKLKKTMKEFRDPLKDIENMLKKMVEDRE